MRLLAGSITLCLLLALSSCTKKEAATDAPVANEQVEGTSSAPSDATPENSPEEMQKKENNDSKVE